MNICISFQQTTMLLTNLITQLVFKVKIDSPKRRNLKNTQGSSSTSL